MPISRVKITDITSEKELQERLLELGNHDSVIQRKEIDSDGDGKFDFNPTTQAWPEYQIRRIESALFAQHLISATHDYPPLLSVTLNNPDKSQLNLRQLDGFDPQVQQGQILNLRHMGLGSLPADWVGLNLAATLEANDPATPVNEGIDNIAHYLIEDYFPHHPEILEECGVTDIRHLTPRQAILVSAMIPIERIDYSDAQVAGQLNDTERVLNDKTPIEQLFRWDRDSDGNGVCRNYSEVAKGILEALKVIQEQATSRLNTTYALYLRSDEKERVPGAVEGHAWSGYVTITADGHIDATVLDSTWADADAQDLAHANESAVAKLDYTSKRFLTLVHAFSEKGLIAPEVMTEDLLQQYNQSTHPTFPHIDATNYKENFKTPPPDYLIGSQILINLQKHPYLIDGLLAPLASFLRTYAAALQDRAREIQEVRPFCLEADFSQYVMAPFLRNLESFTDLCRALPEKFAEKEVGLKICADLLRSSEMASSTLSPDQMEIDSLHDAPPQYRKTAAHFSYVIDLYDWEDSSSQREDFYTQLEAIVGSYSSKDQNYLTRFHLSVAETLDTFSFSPDTLYLVATLSRDEIAEKVANFIQFQRAWDEFKKNCPCEIDLSSFVDDQLGRGLVPSLQTQYATQLPAILAGARAYFDQVDLSLVQYKYISIGGDDDVTDYLHPQISADHFIAQDFQEIDKILKAHRPANYLGLISRREMQRKYLEFEQLPFMTGPIDFTEIPDNKLQFLNVLYEPLHEAIKVLAQNDQETLLQHPLQLTMRPRKFGDPDLAFVLDQDGHVVLFSDIDPVQASQAFNQAARTYAKFWQKIFLLEKDLGQNKLHIVPKYSHELVTDEVLERLTQLEAQLAPFKNQPHLVDNFDIITLAFSTNALEMTLGADTLDGKVRREYVKRFTDSPLSTLVVGLNQFTTQAREIEDRVKKFEIAHSVKIKVKFSEAWGDSFDYLNNTLDKADAFYSIPRPEYEGFTLELTGSGNYYSGDWITPYVVIQKSEKFISVKATTEP